MYFEVTFGVAATMCGIVMASSLLALLLECTVQYTRKYALGVDATNYNYNTVTRANWLLGYHRIEGKECMYRDSVMHKYGSIRDSDMALPIIWALTILVSTGIVLWPISIPVLLYYVIRYVSNKHNKGLVK